MKTLLSVASIFFLFSALTFGQKQDAQEIKNLMGKNSSAGLNPFLGINSVFYVKLSVKMDPSRAKIFDDGMVKKYPGKIFSCFTDLEIGTTTITTEGKMVIDELKIYIYSQGKNAAPPNGVEILNFTQDYYITKN